MAARIAENAPLTIKAVATAVDDILRDPSQRDRAAVDRLVSECFASQDFQEGRTAFLILVILSTILVLLPHTAKEPGAILNMLGQQKQYRFLFFSKINFAKNSHK